MWKENDEKVRIKEYLRNDIESNITNISDTSSRVQDVIVAINRTVAGSVISADSQIIDECKRSLLEMSKALQELYVCGNYVKHLKTLEWVDGE